MKPTKTPKKATDVELFNEGDLVGAKVKGHPLWPGFIEKVQILNNKRKYTVRFFGSEDVGEKFIEMKLFKDFTEKDKACSRKGFKTALEICEKKYIALQSGTKDVSEDISTTEEDLQKYRGADDEKKEKPEDGKKEKQVKKRKRKHEETNEEPVKSARKVRRLEAEVRKQALAEPTSTLSPVQESVGSELKVKIEKTRSDEETTKSPVAPNQSCNLEWKEKKSKRKSNKESKMIETLLDSNDEGRIKCPRSEGENENRTFSRTMAIDKLKKKVRKKLEEKESLKYKKRKEKLFSKVLKKLPFINQKLERFSKYIRKISLHPTIDKIDLNELDSAVQNYEKILPSLNRCADTYLICSKFSSTKMTVGFLECHNFLLDIINDSRVVSKESTLPANIKAKLDLFKTLLKAKEYIAIKNFVQSYHHESANAMIERKENE